jgi:hypothetical protein
MINPRIEIATVITANEPVTEYCGKNSSWFGIIKPLNGEPAEAVIKELDRKQLANEIIGYSLALAAGLRIPKAFLAVSNKSLGFPGALSAPAALQSKTGIADGLLLFASTVSGSPLLSCYETMEWPTDDGDATGDDIPDDGEASVKDILAGWDQLNQTIAFDAWLANYDRNMGNLLLGEDDEVWLIDHTHILDGPLWSAETLSDPHKSCGNYLYGKACSLNIEKPLQIQNAAQQFIQKKRHFLDWCTATVGMDFIAELLHDGEREAAGEFLPGRLAALPDVLTQMIALKGARAC